MFDYLLNEAQKKHRDKVREFVKGLSPEFVKSMDREDAEYPRHFLEELGGAGLLACRFDKKYGGQSLDWVAESAALAEVGTLGSSLACLFSMPCIVGEALHSFGTEEQKMKYLKPTLEGKLVCAEALTEPRGGSDFFGATTTAREEADCYVLNGQKRFIVGGQGADYFMVYARTNPDEKAPAHERISAFIVDRDDSIKIEHVYGLMGTRGGGTARIVFNDTKVKKENVILGKNAGAVVFNKMMVPERLTTASGSVGLARAALEVATRYSTRRKAFGQKIMKFQAVSFHIAEAVARLDSAAALVYATALKVDSGEDARRMVSEAKKVSTEAAWDVVNRAMQVMGGIGYTDVYPIERLLRDARIMMIWTGTNEIMNLLISHEWYNERRGREAEGRDVEADAKSFDKNDEKIYE